jgi:hypothetical protein
MMGCSVCCGEAGGLRANPSQCPYCSEDEPDVCYCCGRFGDFGSDICPECDDDLAGEEAGEEEGLAVAAGDAALRDRATP